MLDMFDLEGRVALVTGASSGLGLSISEILSAAGATVVMSATNEERLSNAVEHVNGLGRATACARRIDVGDRAGIRSAVAEIHGAFGHIDILVANAGISAGPGYNTEIGQLDAVKDATWDRVLDVNLTGVFGSIAAVAPAMKSQRSGRILVVSSVAGIRSEELVGYAYAASKAAVVNLVRQAAMELAQYNVLVNAIAPGPFLTNIAGGRLHDPDVESTFAEKVPLGRIAQPEEIKGLALLLCSDASSFVTGECIAIDGGILAR